MTGDGDVDWARLEASLRADRSLLVASQKTTDGYEQFSLFDLEVE